MLLASLCGAKQGAYDPPSVQLTAELYPEAEEV